jgi:hypothetical protein
MAARKRSTSKSKGTSIVAEAAKLILEQGFETESNCVRLAWTTVDGDRVTMYVVKHKADMKPFGKSDSGNMQLAPKNFGLGRFGTKVPLSLITGDEEDGDHPARVGPGFISRKPFEGETVEDAEEAPRRSPKMRGSF